MLPAAREERLRERQQRAEEVYLPAREEFSDREYQKAVDEAFDDESEEEEPPPKKRSTGSKSSKSGKGKKKTKRDNSDDEDSDQSPKRRPLSQIFHQQRHENRIANHPSTNMPPKTRQGSKSAKSVDKSAKKSKRTPNKDPPKHKKDSEDYDSDSSSSKNDTSQSKYAKMDSESATEVRATLKARYQLVMQEKKHKTTPEKLYSDYQKIVKKNAQQVLFKGLKFFKNEVEHVEAGARFLLPYVKQPHFEDLQGTDLKMSEAIWVHEHADIIRVAINKRRNYAKDEMCKVMKKVFAEGKEHEYPTPEDVEDLVLRRGFDDWENDADHEKMMVKFTNMVDFCIAKVATNYYWCEALRYTEPMLTAMSYKDKNMPPQRGVSPSDLAFFMVLILNYYPLWLHDALEERYQKAQGKDPTTGKYPKYQDAEGKVIQRPATIFTHSDAGVPKLGGWDRDGKKAFYKCQKQIVDNEKNPESHASMLAIDQEALRRMRELHKLEEKEAKRGKRKKPKNQFLDKQAEESDFEEMDCLD